MKLIIDTDIGDDYDDIFTLAIALASPELELLGITTVGGDVALRARLTQRFLGLAKRADIPVATGLPTPVKAKFSHKRWAEAGPPASGVDPDAVDFILRTARAHPGEVTLLAIGPLSNLAEAIKRDAPGFSKLRRIVMMGGSARRGYFDLPWQAATGPMPEYNIVSDIGAAKTVFGCGVPLTVVPLDATMVCLDDLKRQQIFTRSTPVTDALALTYIQWAAASGRAFPILFDSIALATAIDPTMCHMEDLRLAVDDAGFTRIVDGPANAQVCVACNEERFFRWMMPRLIGGAPRSDQTMPAQG
jgi:inosine-uridine nucleoside N-ribohydrolase